MSDELEEKFVSDDGVSTAPEPVTPEGGEIKDKKADVKKKVDPKADKLEMGEEKDNDEEEMEDDDEEEMEESISSDESIAALFEGMDLSEDFKSKVSLVFEAAVNEAVAEKTSELTEQLEEQFEQQMSESVNEAMEEITENLDGYLDYVVSEWMEENAVAIESGIKVQMAESLMSGLKDLFEEHNIEIEEETLDVVSGLEEQVAELEAEANKAISENIELEKAIASLKAEKAFSELTEDLTVSQTERLRTLSEKLDVSDLDSYISDVKTLKESFFKDKKVAVTESVDEEENEILTEESEQKFTSPYQSVNAIVQALNNKNK